MQFYTLLLLCVMCGSSLCSTLYGTTAGIPVYFNKIDTQTAEFTTVGTVTPTLMSRECSAYDSNKGVYYEIGEGSSPTVNLLIGFSISTLELVTLVKLPYNINVPMYMVLEPTSGDLIVVGKTNSGYTMIRVDPAANSTTSIGTFSIDPTAYSFSYKNCAYYPQSDSMFIGFTVNYTSHVIYQISVHTGKIIHTIPTDIQTLSMSYDPVTGMIYGIGSDDISLAVVRFDIGSSSVSIVAKNLYHAVEPGFMNAFDASSRSLVAYLRDSSNNNMFLVTFNIDTGNEVVSAMLPQVETYRYIASTLEFVP